MCILFIIVNNYDAWLPWQHFETMCKLFNDIDEANMRYLKLVSIVELSCASLVIKMIFFILLLFLMVHNLILLYKIGT